MCVCVERSEFVSGKKRLLLVCDVSSLKLDSLSLCRNDNVVVSVSISDFFSCDLLSS